jgi:anti-sigma regulatory factor (Ser/Thr protein kinase)
MAEEILDIVRVVVPCDAEAPRRARDALSQVEGLGATGMEARLVASELVSNAVLHSGCTPNHELKVEVRLGPGMLEISVLDPALSSHEPEVQTDSQVGGLGLAIVEQLAHRWGVARPALTVASSGPS